MLQPPYMAQRGFMPNHTTCVNLNGVASHWSQDAYGLEKLATEELCKHYDQDFGIECRVARFHNIYGPHGTWKGGREKAPAAFCRKVSDAAVLSISVLACFAELLILHLTAWHCTLFFQVLTSATEIEMWGDGKQTRSFTFIDDCVEGILRITKSDFKEPLNLGRCAGAGMAGDDGKDDRGEQGCCAAAWCDTFWEACGDCFCLPASAAQAGINLL